MKLSLFPSETIVNKLCDTDILKMTPLDAINYLNDLKKDALKVKDNNLC